MGSANAATIMDLLSATSQGLSLFREMRRSQEEEQGRGFDPAIAAIRGEGTSNDYFPAKCLHCPPSICKSHLDHHPQSQPRLLDWYGLHNNRRVWEHDEEFKAYLRRIRAMAVDMETATLFITGFQNKIPTGALLLVSDQPMIPRRHQDRQQ